MRTGNAEVGDNFKAGAGDAFDSIASRGSRRKRSSFPNFLPENLIKLVSSSGIRSKRQAGSSTEQSPEMSTSTNPNSNMDKIKAAFSRIMDAAKDLLQKIKQSMSGAAQKASSSNDVENMQ